MTSKRSRNRLSFFIAIFTMIMVIFAMTSIVYAGESSVWSETINTAKEGTDYQLQQEDNTYTVYSGAGLVYALKSVDDSGDKASIVLANDLDLSGKKWDCPADDFYGVTFQGNGHTIKGIDPADDTDAFLAGDAYDSVFKNITITGEWNVKEQFSLLANYAGGDSLQVENCKVIGKLSLQYTKDSEGDDFGLLFASGGSEAAQLNKVTIDVNTTVDTAREIDDFGLVYGEFYGTNLTMKNCQISGPITVKNTAGSSSSCKHLGMAIGMIETWSAGNSTFENCTTAGDMVFENAQNWEAVGGMIGYMEPYEGRNSAGILTMENCSHSGNIKLDTKGAEIENLGGVIGKTKNLKTIKVSNSKMTGDISIDNAGDMYLGGGLGGFAGMLSAEDAVLSGVSYSGTLAATEKGSEQERVYCAAGIVAYLDTDNHYEISDAVIQGDIKLKNTETNYVGGCTAYAFARDDSSMTNNSYTGNIVLDHVKNLDYVGGMLGQHYMNDGVLTMNGCVVKGNIEVKNKCDNLTDLAGLLGRSYCEVNMYDSHYYGDITMDGSVFNSTCGYVGGIAGESFDDLTLDNSSAEGDITITDAKHIHMVGGLVGYSKGKFTATSTETKDSMKTCEAQKLWKGDDASKRPESIQVQLYADDQPYGDPVILNNENNWSYKWDNLPNPSAGTHHKGDITIENSSFYSEDGAWIGGILGEYEGDLDIQKVYQDGNINVKNCEGYGNVKRLIAGGWIGGTGSEDAPGGSGPTDTTAITKDSYCITKVNVTENKDLGDGIYTGGITGAIRKENAKFDFKDFYLKGSNETQESKAADAGLLFGNLKQLGSYEDVSFHEKRAEDCGMQNQLIGNKEFEKALEKEVKAAEKDTTPIQGNVTYTVKEIVPEGYTASYEKNGNQIIITNTWNKSGDSGTTTDKNNGSGNNTGNHDKADKGVQTGDNAPIGLWVALAVLSAAAMIAVILVRRNHRFY